MHDRGPKNRVELESQILCAALRQSWAADDPKGSVTSAIELYQLFPDLLPPPRNLKVEPVDYYKTLGLGPQTNPTSAVVSFFRKLREMLRHGGVKERREEYLRLLDAGFVLRKPRLRLSHDLVIVRKWLVDTGTIEEDGTLEVKHLGPEAAEEQLAKTQPLQSELPSLVKLLKEAQIIGPPEVQAMVAQMTLAPEIPIERLILDSGYVSPQEMNSLKLAEYLLDTGKITMAQFQVAIYDERTSGIRMAESLQVRGWLPVDVTPSSLSSEEGKPKS